MCELAKYNEHNIYTWASNNEKCNKTIYGARARGFPRNDIELVKKRLCTNKLVMHE